MSQALTAETPKRPGVTLTAGPPRVAAIATDGLSAISTGDLVWEVLTLVYFLDPLLLHRFVLG